MATEEKVTEGLENQSKDLVAVTPALECIKDEALEKNEKIIGPALPKPTYSDESQLKIQDIFIGDHGRNFCFKIVRQVI